MKTLRPYQSAALKSIWQWIHEKETQPLVVAPVGSGKSLMIAEFIRQCHAKWPQTRILMLTHDKRLLEQNMAELKEQYPDADAGYYCAGLKQKRLTNDITFASIQSIHSKAALLNRAPNVILIDECHLVNPKAATRYRAFLEDCFALNPRARVIGFTGSPFRSDTGYLHTGSERLFDGICYEIPIGWMIDEGFLARPVLPPITTKMDVTGVGMRAGDYIDSQLDDAINTDEINRECVAEIITNGKDRKAWLVFTVTKDHCDNVVQEFKDNGISVAGIHSGMPKGEVAENIKLFKAGKIQCLVNVAMLTTGFNYPDIDLLAFMRPTRSPVLYIQCTGRGLRTVYASGYDLSTQQGRLDAIAASGKKNCMILDFGGVISSLGPIDNIDLSNIRDKSVNDSESKPPEELPTKLCPKCETVCKIAQKICYGCGHKFPDGLGIGTQANREDAILQADVEPERIKVLDMSLSKHRKSTPEGTPPATPVMKVTYNTLAGNIYEWVCLEHSGFARKKAAAWHAKFMPKFPKLAPATVDLALEFHRTGNEDNRYRTPSYIIAKKNGKFWTVEDYEFPAPKDEAQKQLEAEIALTNQWLDA
jgi:DNA repair protein RadD